MRAGVQVAEAIKALAEAGITAQALAAELGRNVRTIRRWAAGQHQPRPANLAKLRDYVSWQVAEVQHRRGIASQRQLSTLQRAKHALTPEVERAEQARLADSIRRTMLAALHQHQSVTTQVNPFALAGSTDDDLFGVAA